MQRQQPSQFVHQSPILHARTFLRPTSAQLSMVGRLLTLLLRLIIALPLLAIGAGSVGGAAIFLLQRQVGPWHPVKLVDLPGGIAPNLIAACFIAGFGLIIFGLGIVIVASMARTIRSFFPPRNRTRIRHFAEWRLEIAARLRAISEELQAHF